MKKRITIDKELTVKELAQLLEVLESQIIKYLFYDLEIMRTVNQIVEVDTAKQVARYLGFEVTD